MLRIENLKLIQSKFAGTNEWQVAEIFVSDGCYVFQIRKREGSWAIGPNYFNELTVRLARERLNGSGYIMETAFVRLNKHYKSIHTFEDFKSITSFTKCLDIHINDYVLKNN
jgi:hypothetical protein